MPEVEADPLRRHKKEEPAEKAAPAPPKTDDDELDALDKDPKPKKKDRLDYSRFKNCGDDTKDARIATGDIVWDDLNMDEKKHVWDKENEIEAMLAKKREEEDEWKRQLRDKPSDLSWCKGQHFTTYESFCVGRVESTFKKSGNEAFKAGETEAARQNWEAGIEMLLALGTLPPEAWTLICVLRNNLAQLYMKAGNWNKVKEMTDKVIDREPKNQKALYRRAQTFAEMSIHDKAEKDLEVLIKHYPENKEAAKLFAQVQKKLGRDKKKFSKAVDDIGNGIEELTSDGTVRKLKVEEYGEGNPDEPPKWFDEKFLGTLGDKCRDRAVVTCQMVITSVGGEELYNSREYRPHPETKKGRDELKEYMDMVQFLDEEASKKPRMVGDFYQKVKKKPVRWFLGDPGMYKGFDLAVRSMKHKERSVFEVDQPMLNPSVEEYYKKIGFHSGIAGLPQLVYHIEEERLSILEDQMPEAELDIDTKTQRGVRVEIELMAMFVYRDVSLNLDSSKLHGVLYPGNPSDPLIKKGDLIRGGFFITRPFDGSLLTQNTYVEWRLGEDEGMYECEGENKEPLRPGGGSYVPKCVCDALLSVDWMPLHWGCLVEVRTRVGPELHEICPQYAKQFEQARRENHKKGKRGGAPCSIMVQIYPAEFGRPDNDAPKQQYLDESNIQDLDID